MLRRMIVWRDFASGAGKFFCENVDESDWALARLRWILACGRSGHRSVMWIDVDNGPQGGQGSVGIFGSDLLEQVWREAEEGLGHLGVKVGPDAALDFREGRVEGDGL